MVFAHFRADTVDPVRHYVDPVALDAIGRMGGHGYATTRDRFDLRTMSVEEWRHADQVQNWGASAVRPKFSGTG